MTLVVIAIVVVVIASAVGLNQLYVRHVKKQIHDGDFDEDEATMSPEMRDVALGKAMRKKLR